MLISLLQEGAVRILLLLRGQDSNRSGAPACAIEGHAASRIFRNDTENDAFEKRFTHGFGKCDRDHARNFDVFRASRNGLTLLPPAS